MESASLFLSLLGEGQSLAQIFGGGPNFADMLKQLERDIQEIFHKELADDAIRVATAAANNTSMWLGNDYLDAVKRGETKAQLWDLLDAASDGPDLETLREQASIMESWASDAPDAIAQQTASLALMIHGLIVAVYRERSLQAPDSNVATAEVDNMRAYAQSGFRRVAPLFATFRQARFSGISTPVRRDENVHPEVWDLVDSWAADSLSANFVLSVVEWPYSGRDPKSEIHKAWLAYLRLLQTGSDAAADDFRNAVSPPGGFSPSNANYLPGFQATGKWIASAPKGLRSLLKIAGGPVEYEVAYQGAEQGTLCTFGNAGSNDWLLGMGNGTAPSIVGSPDGGFFISFQTSQGVLFHASSGGNASDGIPMASNSSPSVVRLADGSFRSWYQAPSNNVAALTSGADHNSLEYGLGMMPGTSPSAALLPGGDPIFAFQANTRMLWIGDSGTPVQMASGSSPSLAVLANGAWLVAVAGANGTLSTFDGTDGATFPAQVAAGTNPVLAASDDGSYQIAFQGADGTLQLAGPDGIIATNEKMMASTSPGIAALMIGGYQTAFQDPNGNPVTLGDAGRDTGPAMHANASPAIAGITLVI
jgi:hypothetical protein